MHVKGRRTSDWGLALMEKQKIKHYYGLGERQLRRYYDKASSMKGNTGEQLLLLCESRLDNVWAGFTKTRPQARQGTARALSRNGIKARPYIPAGRCHRRPRTNLQNYCDLANSSAQTLDWITFDAEQLRATMLGFPVRAILGPPERQYGGRVSAR
jgi:small subunit ribosomal protein S4